MFNRLGLFSGIFGFLMLVSGCGAASAEIGEAFLLCEETPVAIAGADLTLTFDGRGRLILDDGEVEEVIVEINSPQGTERFFFMDSLAPGTPSGLETVKNGYAIRMIDTYASSPDDESADCAEFIVRNT